MRKFKRLNVIKETDSDLVAGRLIEAGFEEVVEDNEIEAGFEEVVEGSEPEDLSRDDIKAQLDEAGIEYAKNAKTETLLEILEASKLGEQSATLLFKLEVCMIISLEEALKLDADATQDADAIRSLS